MDTNKKLKVTDKDIQWLADAVSPATNHKNQKGYITFSQTFSQYLTNRFVRAKEQGLIEYALIEGLDRWGWKPSAKGLELIAPILAERERKAAEKENKHLADNELAERKRNEIVAELQAAGVENINVRDTMYFTANGDYLIRLRYLSIRHTNFSSNDAAGYRGDYDPIGHYVVELSSTGRVDPDALAVEVQQAKIARDLLNSKLKKDAQS